MVAQDNTWDKAKAQVEEVITMIETDPDRLDRKRLEQVRGLLQYTTVRYPDIFGNYPVYYRISFDYRRLER
jgi:hypothetical protein